MKSNPLFSVLIANYNNGRYLEEAISSVLAQTYTNWEIILVDDGSDDNSAEILEEYKNDKRIRIFFNEKNRGCGFTKRKCVELANGEICGFLDPDDALLPKACELMINAHITHPEISLVLSRFYFCDENLAIQNESTFSNIPLGESYLTSRNYKPEPFASFKKSYYDKTEGLSSKYRLGVDQDLYFKLEEVGKIFILKDLTYKYRQHDKSIAYDNRKSFYWNLIVRHEACLRRGLDPELYPYKDYISAFAYYSLSEQEQKQIYKAEIELNIIRNSKAYRLGRFLLAPLRFIFRQK